MIFMLPAANTFDVSGRVSGWRQPTTPRKELRKLDVLVPRLRELSIIGIIASDLDEITAKYLARKLEVPFELWESLRRYNAGRSHGLECAKFEKLLNSVQDPIVPVKGGDSRVSFGKRVAGARERLAKARQNILVVADSRVIGALLNQEAKLERCRLYAVDLSKGEAASGPGSKAATA